MDGLVTQRTPARVGAVLAGGRGARLGGAKPVALLGGRPLVAWAVAAMRDAGLAPLVVAKRDTALPPGLGCPVLLEPDVPRHPLAGVLAALGAAGPGGVVVAPVDLPFVPPAVLRRLAEHDRDAVCAFPGGGVQPLLARYTPASTPRLADALGRQSAMRDAVAALGAAVLDVDDRRAAVNVNDAADLAHAEALLGAEG